MQDVCVEMLNLVQITMLMEMIVLPVRKLRVNDKSCVGVHC